VTAVLPAAVSTVGESIVTILQRRVRELIERYEAKHSVKLSGGELSARLGKSRNHLSQILNDGLVPSGELLSRLAHVLEASEEDHRELLLCAMKVKAQGRARDTFWLQQALDLLEQLNGKIAVYVDYLQLHQRTQDFEQWALGRKPAPPKKPRGTKGEKPRERGSEAADGA
jgi:transcriptional regulator with XRE-family HTH domain